MNKQYSILGAFVLSAVLSACGGSSEKSAPEELNQAPVVVFTEAAITVEVGDSVTVDASASSDAEGAALSYSWSGLDSVLEETSDQVTLEGLAIGEYELTVTVSDGEKTSTASATISVTGPAVIEVSDLNTGTTAEPVMVYYDLDTATELLLTEAEAETNQEWDIAFKRTKIFLNRYAATPVTTYFTENTTDFYDDEGNVVVDRFVNATASTELDAFVAASGATPADASFNGDAVKNAIEGFYTYNFASHSTAANPEAYFIVSSDSTYSQFRVTSLIQNGFGVDNYVLEISNQASDSDSFSNTTSLPIDATDCVGDIYVDLATQTIANEGDAWDLRIPCADGLASHEIHIASDAKALSGEYGKLSGVVAASVPYYPWVENEYEVRAIAEYGDANSRYGWAEYGVNGGHVMWPNFAIYIIKTDVGLYKFQVTGYYDAQGVSGSFSIRHQKVLVSEG